MSRNTFPVTARDTVEPSPPELEPTREQVNANPEDFPAFMRRTRRYFRLTHQRPQLHYARGLETDPDEMA